MNKAAYALKLPQSLKSAAQRLAREDGVSLNQWIVVALAEKVGAVETSADFLKRRAMRADPSTFQSILDRVGSHPPLTGDELPAEKGR
ncbi:toxin-antitoxin system HicB family antitoxin [Acidithiobacillus caldus]|uniref:toxin-antitoxin system HicB family antitoxin n=1 Tax=Acidithiobacillus caldus TaxID=33059 RepID=UPI0008725723|nr:toxin-antitoxin system HicB family antitoxin [Acidithiobacillus caldus]OFC36774.1 pilus assembly protein HicB [Acidithiobacillus caldus]OFC38384.1 pilus assembly protein HicB [Acidithiobacillus caldus]